MSFHIRVLSQGISLEDACSRIAGLDEVFTATIVKVDGKEIIEATPALGVSRSKVSKKIHEVMKPYALSVWNKPIAGLPRSNPIRRHR